MASEDLQSCPSPSGRDPRAGFPELALESGLRSAAVNESESSLSIGQQGHLSFQGAHRHE